MVAMSGEPVQELMKVDLTTTSVREL
ncbi:MAG: hypothetical protein QOD82_7589, partial [Pseudonocardiales bacterium]|nr:hypothetical protein [Pseudonocardiales bacterium]